MRGIISPTFVILCLGIPFGAFGKDRSSNNSHVLGPIFGGRPETSIQCPALVNNAELSEFIHQEVSPNGITSIDREKGVVVVNRERILPSGVATIMGACSQFTLAQAEGQSELVRAAEAYAIRADADTRSVETGWKWGTVNMALIGDKQVFIDGDKIAVGAQTAPVAASLDAFGYADPFGGAMGFSNVFQTQAALMGGHGAHGMHGVYVDPFAGTGCAPICGQEGKDTDKKSDIEQGKPVDSVERAILIKEVHELHERKVYLTPAPLADPPPPVIPESISDLRALRDGLKMEVNTLSLERITPDSTTK